MPFLLLLVTWLSWGVAYPVTGIALGGFDVVTLRVLVQLLGAAAIAITLAEQARARPRTA
jgi:hypothetical protein